MYFFWYILSPCISHVYCSGFNSATSWEFRGHWNLAPSNLLYRRRKPSPSQRSPLILSSFLPQKRKRTFLQSSAIPWEKPCACESRWAACWRNLRPEPPGIQGAAWLAHLRRWRPETWCLLCPRRLWAVCESSGKTRRMLQGQKRLGKKSPYQHCQFRKILFRQNDWGLCSRHLED